MLKILKQMIIYCKNNLKIKKKYLIERECRVIMTDAVEIHTGFDGLRLGLLCRGFALAEGIS